MICLVQYEQMTETVDLPQYFVSCKTRNSLSPHAKFMPLDGSAIMTSTQSIVQLTYEVPHVSGKRHVVTFRKEQAE